MQIFSFIIQIILIMKKVLAVLAIRPEYAEFAVPQLKALLAPLNIPLPTLLSQSSPLPHNHYEINHKTVKNFPHIVLTVPDFDEKRQYLQMASKKAVMVSKFVLLISEGKNYQELFDNRDQQILNTQCRDWNQLVACDFLSRNRVITRDDQVKKIHAVLEKLDVRGKIDIKKATKRFQLIEQHSWYHGHHETEVESTLEKVFFGIELSSCKLGRAKFNINYQLGQRIYLGPTSADNDLAFLMCNQARIGNGSLVFDPFVGTGGLLIPPSSHGAIVFGCDLDMRVLNGYAVGRINKKSSYYSPEKGFETFIPKIYLSFDQYDLMRPNIMRMDSTRGGFAAHTQFDAIITDPPYGIRAMSRSMKKKEAPEEGEVKVEEEPITEEQIEMKEGEEIKVQKSEEELAFEKRKQQKKDKKKINKQKRREQMTQEEHQFKKQVVEKLNTDRLEKWGKFDKGKIENTARQTIFQGLLNLGRNHLKAGGRLVFLYPIYEEEKFIGIENLPDHDGFEVIDMSENVLSSNNSRILVTLEKLKQQ